MVTLKLHTINELNILVQYVTLIIESMETEYGSLSHRSGVDGLKLTAYMELMDQFLRKLKIKQIDNKNTNTFKLLDLVAIILIEYNHKYFINDKFGQNVILESTSAIHKQLINH